MREWADPDLPEGAGSAFFLGNVAQSRRWRRHPLHASGQGLLTLLRFAGTMVRQFLCLVLLCFFGSVQADTLRVALYTTELDREGPGLLLRDIQKRDAQVVAVARVIAHAAPDVVVLLRFDHDAGGLALGAFTDLLAELGAPYPYRFALRPNTGLMTDLDLDGDGLLRGPRDAQGYGMFSGQNGVAILSKLPIDASAVRDFSGVLWKDLPGATLPVMEGRAYPSAAAQAVQRLSTTVHWDVPVLLPDGGAMHLLVYHATPPVFDGPEDRNGLRNRDETRFWSLLLDGELATPPPSGPVVLIGNSNLDPAGGDGISSAMADLLAHPHLQDPMPQSPGARLGGFRPPPVSAADTVAWDADGEPGNLRVDYILPDRQLEIAESGVVWPAPDDPLAALLGEGGRGASRHRLVWVDLVVPGGSAGFLDPSGGRG